MSEKKYNKSVLTARISIWLAAQASCNKGLLSKLCKIILSRAMRIDSEHDFMKDPLIDADQGYSVEALRKFERGE